ncbi:MAG: trimethylamine methyltransferase family protein [Thermofilum sp.]|jgi:trimethylamine--corrinoid protein Co-methyltransferase|nr:trimethylamine methyltransferase family protein [Thermofilum sp.]
MARPRLLVLDRDEADAVHSDALSLLGEVGVRLESREVEKLLLDAGCTLRGGRVLVPEELVREALAKAPKRIELYDRDGRRVSTLGEGALVFNPGSAAIKLLDFGSSEPRTPTLEDLRRFVVLADALDGVEAQSTALVPGDAPVEVRDAVRLYVVLKYSRKPVVTGAFTVENLPLMVEMLRAVREDYRERPFAIFDACPTPPLSWSTITSHNVVDLARLGVPAEIISMPGLLGTAPATVYGALVQHHAEVLSGVVIAQLARPGAPVIYGGSPTVIHPYHGTSLITAPEAALVSLAYRDMARYLDLPSHTYMALSDAKSPDYQAGAEAAFTAALAAAAGFDVVSGPGMLEFESVQSLEKLVLDNEVCLLAKRIARGFARDSDSVGVIREVVLQKRGNFLAHRHTRETYRREIHLPKVWDVASRARGTRDLLKWAHEEVERILREHEPPVLEGDRLERLDEVLSRLYGRVGQSPPRV